MSSMYVSTEMRPAPDTATQADNMKPQVVAVDATCLVDHAAARGAVLPTDSLLRYRDGHPLISRRHDHLWIRLGEQLTWVEPRLWRTFGGGYPRRMRWRRRARPARPYICRLSSLVLVLTPSVRPLWWLRVMAAVTASMSWWTPRAKECT